tara:strand:- start:199 stop:486 length:288 start_codon:yes stop_codon:yes gene_type:complete
MNNASPISQLRKEKYMKNLEETLVKIVDSIDTIVTTQRSVQEFMQGQLEANEFLAKRIKELETKVMMAEHTNRVIDTISGIIPTTEMQDVESTRD